LSCHAREHSQFVSFVLFVLARVTIVLVVLIAVPILSLVIANRLRRVKVHQDAEGFVYVAKHSPAHDPDELGNAQ
jgi:hypothetical protein